MTGKLLAHPLAFGSGELKNKVILKIFQFIMFKWTLLVVNGKVVF